MRCLLWVFSPFQIVSCGTNLSRFQPFLRLYLKFNTDIPLKVFILSVILELPLFVLGVGRRTQPIWGISKSDILFNQSIICRKVLSSMYYVIFRWASGGKNSEQSAISSNILRSYCWSHDFFLDFTTNRK
jgi:hypothetical protein